MRSQKYVYRTPVDLVHAHRHSLQYKSPPPRPSTGFQKNYKYKYNLYYSTGYQEYIVVVSAKSIVDSFQQKIYYYYR